MRSFKKAVSLLLVVVMVISHLTFLTIPVDAVNSYNINGKIVKYTDFTSSSDGCWTYANNIYNKIWGAGFTNSFSSNDNSLKNLSDSELTLTIEHLKAYVTNASVGSVLRVCNSPNLHSHDGTISGHPGHSMIIVQKDSDGFTVFEGGVSSASNYRREKYYTWSSLIETWNFEYIKYIKWPGAEPYSSIDTSYSTPFVATVNSDTDITAYDGINGNTNGVLWVDEVCTVLEVYTNGWCKLEDSLHQTKYIQYSFLTPVVDLGTDFYAVILNTNHWKPITCDDDKYVRLRTEVGVANRLWRFVRQDDGSYVISSCDTGRALEMDSGITDEGNPVSAWSEDWGGYYQRWFLIPEGEGYIFLSNHYTSKNLVMELENNSSLDGTPIVTNKRHNGNSQIWSLYYHELTSPTLTVVPGKSNSETTFTWSNVYGENCYNLRIWKDKIGEGTDYTKWYASSGLKTVLPAGQYYAYVDACNYYEIKMSNTVTFTINPVYTISHWFGGFKYNEGDNSSKTMKILGTSTFESAAGSTYSLSTGKALKVPNGYYIKSTFGTSSIAGSWNQYNMGTTVTQKSDNMSYEYYYYPNVYNITYNLNGGTNASTNPSTYSVLYGFTLANPTREGYTFAGWTDANGNRVYGINAGKNASFATNATYSEFCNELAGRTTGDQTLTANWIADSYTIKYDANSGEGAPASQTKVHNETLVLSTEIPTLKGYTFLGWSTDKNATVADYLPGAEFNVNADTTLYAVWQKGCSGEHNYETVVTEPTCTLEGYTTYTCTDCDFTYTDKSVVPLGHSTELINYVEPTCTEDGYSGDTVCYVCSEVIEKGHNIEMLGHNYSETVTPPTCTEDGYTKIMCTICKDSFTGDYTDALGHAYEASVLKIPTAETKGVLEATCTACGDYVTAVLPILSDEYYTVEVSADPTCTESGNTLYTLKDTAYGIVTIEVVTDSFGHDYDSEVTAPTCTTDGYTEYICVHCGDSYKGDHVYALGHSYENGACTLCGAAAPEVDDSEYTKGDINTDGAVNGKDTNQLKQFISGSSMPTEAELLASDVNGDGAINGVDANIFAQFLAGALGSFE